MTTSITPPEGCPFRVGDRVMVTAEDAPGHVCGPFTITGFRHPESDFYRKGTVYLDWDCHWCPIDWRQLSLAEEEAATDAPV